MKVGDIVMHRDGWTRDGDGHVIVPPPNDEGWIGPILILEQYDPPNDALFVALYCGQEIVIGRAAGLSEIKVISAS
jgi:hypothetical protein